jgi:hypothetical protein
MTIYRVELAGQFLARRKLAKNSVAWLEDEIKAWIKSMPSASSSGCTVLRCDGIRWHKKPGCRIAAFAATVVTY